MKKKLLFFIICLLIVVGLFWGARFLFAPTYGKEMPVALSNKARVAASDAGVYVVDGEKLFLVSKNDKKVITTSFHEPIFTAVGKNLYIADGMKLYSYNPKLVLIDEITTPEEVRTFAVYDRTLYYGMKDQTVRVKDGEASSLSTPGYPVRLCKDKDALIALTLEDKNEHLKSRLYLFRDGKDDMSFGFLDEVMENAAYRNGHLYIITNRSYYHFLDARLVEKNEIMRLRSATQDDETLLYLDDTNLVRIALDDGTKTVTKINDADRIVRAKKKTLLLGKNATVLSDDGSVNPALEQKQVLDGFAFQNELYLVTPQGIYKHFQK